MNEPSDLELQAAYERELKEAEARFDRLVQRRRIRLFLIYLVMLVAVLVFLWLDDERPVTKVPGVKAVAAPLPAYVEMPESRLRLDPPPAPASSETNTAADTGMGAEKP